MENISANHTRYNLSFLWSICLVAAMGGLLFGYDWVVVGGAKLFYEAYFNLETESLQGWGASSALIGCLLGAILSGALSDRFGRKDTLAESILSRVGGPEYARLEMLDIQQTLAAEEIARVNFRDLLRVRQEELVDSVIVDATIYNPGGPHLGAFPGLLFSAFRQ